MKNITLSFLLIISLVTLSSCGGDDDSNDNTSNGNLLIGTWDLIEYTSNGQSYFDPDDCLDQEVFIFSSSDLTIQNFEEDNNGNCVLEEEFKIPYTINGNTITISNDYFGTFSVNETQFILTEQYEEGGENYTDISTYQRRN